MIYVQQASKLIVRCSSWSKIHHFTVYGRCSPFVRWSAEIIPAGEHFSLPVAWPDSPWRKTYGNASEPVIVTAAGRGQSGDLNNLLRSSHLLISLFSLLSYICFVGDVHKLRRLARLIARRGFAAFWGLIWWGKALWKVTTKIILTFIFSDQSELISRPLQWQPWLFLTLVCQLGNWSRLKWSVGQLTTQASG